MNYEPTMATEMDYNKYKLIRLEAIKSIYINEDLSIMCRYADPRMSPLEVDKFYSCVVFIETFPEDKIPTDAGKGVRKPGWKVTARLKNFIVRIIPSSHRSRITAVRSTGILRLSLIKKVKPVSGSTITVVAESSVLVPRRLPQME